MNLSRRRKSEDKDAYRVGIDKKALVALKLSSVSFLSSNIFDPLSSGTPLYTVYTVTTSTSILRTTSEGIIIAADIRWPRQSAANNRRKAASGTLIQMNGGRWQAGENFLTPQTLLSIPQFRIPGFSHSLKWKRVGNTYHCVTSTVKGPIAILDLFTPTSPFRLSVYETLHDKYDTNPLRSYSGVSLLLLDYLVTSALLLVTSPQEWMIVPKPNDTTNIISRIREAKDKPRAEQPQASASGNTSSVRDRWRNEVRGEPGYPTIKPRPSAATLHGKMPSSEQLRKILYGEALFPKRRPQSLSSLNLSVSDIDENSIEDDESASESILGLSGGPPWLSLPQETMSPSTESTNYPRSNTPSAPDHSYLDPSFYSSPLPPVPPLPSIYHPQTQAARRSNEARHSSQDSLLESTLQEQRPVDQHIEPSFARRIVHSPSNSTIGRDIDLTSITASSGSTPSIRTRRLPQPPVNVNEFTPPNPSFARTIQKRSSSYSTRSVRSLPPTPVDARTAVSSPTSALSAMSEKATTAPIQPRRESTYPGTRDSIFEPPPPAYHAIDFARPVSSSTTPFRALPQPPSRH